MTEQAVDSRNYIVAFELRSAADCPSDFRIPAAAAAFDTGVFLPRDDPDWFGRYTYPPRVLLLARRALWVIPHPSARETPGLCSIEHISSVESGHMLLKGWLRFSGNGFHCTVPYNTRGQPSVLRFMRPFRTAWLGSGKLSPDSAAIGDDLDVRFANALADELDPEEMPAARFFQSPRELKRRWPVRRTQSLPGDLLVLTGRRIIWITDRHRGTRAQFGAIVSYAPVRSLRDMRTASDGNKWYLQLDLTGTLWLVPLEAGYRSEAEAFAEWTLAQVDLAGRSAPSRPPESAHGITRYGSDLARSR